MYAGNNKRCTDCGKRLQPGKVLEMANKKMKTAPGVSIQGAG